MAISAKDVMELRKQTDCGMMECKKALTEADGNFEKAIEILRERGLATAAKKDPYFPKWFRRVYRKSPYTGPTAGRTASG